MISRYFVERVTGLRVAGDAGSSPSLAKMHALREAASATRNAKRIASKGANVAVVNVTAYNENVGQGEVVALRTSFPHTSGKLASWDDDIPRAFVVLRNPLHAIPCYFNQMYEMRSHLPAGGSSLPENREAAVAAWTKWRDNQLRSQTMLYRRFVSFWMEKYLGNEGDRLYFSYEAFVDDDTGPAEATRLARFMESGMRAGAIEWAMSSMEGRDPDDPGEQPFDSFLKKGMSPQEGIDGAIAEALRTVVPEGDVPCVWEGIVRSTVAGRPPGSNKPPVAGGGGGGDAEDDDEEAFEGVGDCWIPADRPYTPDDLASMSQMLLELMNRWSRHQRLLSILSKYHREVNRAYLMSVGRLEEALEESAKLQKAPAPDLYAQQQQQQQQQRGADGGGEQMQQQQPPPTEVKPPPTMVPFHIIQASPRVGAGSTVATNWLVGLFEPEKDVAFMEDDWPERPVRLSGRDTTIDSTIVTKTHNLNLLAMYKQIRPHFEEVFFVVSNRGNDPGTRVSKELCGYKNVLCIEDEELLYNDEEGLRAMVGALTEKLTKRFEYYFGANSAWLAPENQLNAVERLDAMARIAADMAKEPVDKVDERFGIHGGNGAGGGSEGNSAAGDSAPLAADAAIAGGASDERSGRRRLSVALQGGGCEITWPQPPKGNIQTAYAASYPGCGARMSWNLIEALTGLWTGDDWDNNGRGKNVVTVKTHYPHDAGQLVPWDSEINRALVIIRNPMKAIPSFFNHIYEIKNNLAIHSQRAPVSDWIEWRDRLAMNQIKKFAKFVDYWMERFDTNDRARIWISYETLTDDYEGPQEAIRINNFLAQSEGVEPIATESVPCVWKAVVKYKEQVSDSQKRRLDDGRRRLDPAHHDSQRSGPTERPYTLEQLEAMSKMLLDLIHRWGDRHLRLKKTLEKYRVDVQTAYLALTESPSGNPQSSTKNFHIIQVSIPNTGSTVLNNALVGFFDPDAEYKKSSIVTKTHDTDLLSLYKKERQLWDEVFFVVSNRGTDRTTRLDSELCDYDNVLCIEYEELQYGNHQELRSMVDNLAGRFNSRFEYYFGPELLDESKKMDAVKRVEAMDNAVAALKNQPSDTKDEKFGGIGGNANDAGRKSASRFQVNGKSFHIFQVSPPHTESIFVTNWLMGLFEPDQDYSFMVNNRDQTVRQHDMTVPIDSTVVTKTHILDLMMLYKQYRSQFDEIFFVTSNHGTRPESRIDASVCQYDNVLCIEEEEFQISDDQEIENIVVNLTRKFAKRFEYFFETEETNSVFLGEENVDSAITRVGRMAQVAVTMKNAPYSVSDPRYGVHGGLQDKVGTETQVVGLSRGKLFYCGGAQGLLDTENFKYSTFGLFLAKSLFPDFDGKIEFRPGKKLENSATPLTEDTMKSATENDLLIMHAHQHCEVAVEMFPGVQLHINSEFYDIHPVHLDNPDGALTLDYLPPGQRSFVIGPHEDTSKSIRVPFCSMRLWYLHMSRHLELNRIFLPAFKPKNSKENFLLYVNSHYIEYRERAARALSEIGTIHTAGKCQGYFEANPAPPDDDSATQCVPFKDGKRPVTIQPISGQSGLEQQHNNMELFSHYRYALVMENTNVPGYVSEKILHAFLSGTVPIYYGSRFVFEIFNPKAFIYFDLDTPLQALSQIRFLEQNPLEYEKMLNEPILAHGEETIEKYFSWDETVGSGRLKSRIRAMMGLG